MHSWALEYAGVEISLESGSYEAIELIEQALVGLNMWPSRQSNAIRIGLERRNDGWLLKDHYSNLELEIALLGDVIYHLTDRLVFHVANNASHRHCVHAAAVGINGKSIVIPASSGAGKSTFTCWLVANGFKYISDELVLVDESGAMNGVARPIQIKASGLHAIQPLLKEGSKMYAGKQANAIPVSAIGGEFCDADSRLAAFVFPTYSAGTGYDFKRLDSANAGMKLMSNHVNARNLDGHGFKAMMALIRKHPCFELEYGGFECLPSNFKDILIERLSA